MKIRNRNGNTYTCKISERFDCHSEWNTAIFRHLESGWNSFGSGSHHSPVGVEKRIIDSRILNCWFLLLLHVHLSLWSSIRLLRWLLLHRLLHLLLHRLLHLLLHWLLHLLGLSILKIQRVSFYYYPSTYLLGCWVGTSSKWV